MKYKGDNLARVLVAGTKIKNTETLARNLLDIEIKMWIDKPEIDVKKVFGLLELDQIQGKIGRNPLLTKWIDFFDSRFSDPSPRNKFKAMLDFMISHDRFKMYLASALVAGTRVEAKRPIALERLHNMIRAVAENSKVDVEGLFKILELDLTQSPLLFKKWLDFLKTRILKLPGKVNFEAVLDIVEKHCNNEDLASVLKREQR